MTEKEKLAIEIECHLDGIKVQWQDIERQTDPALVASKRDGVFATIDFLKELIRQYDEMQDDA
ncbi:hypothetical protein KUD11_12875 [Roseovarius sp. LXJ103]|uniref:hypothetical protein n=1 Tax=Roseovarius carneus TaxID=2853164 RepID=UPI000D62199D|nr:hypothetical protein [Roseovarius carneus]MBZ8119536.1 hypothetical protein [Roseovarius carneus]PWE34838.1 hypothetical protein DD563_01875 [Pelagicola sp. LXJ1103]